MIEDRLSSSLINSGYQRMDSNAQGIYLFYRVEENEIMLISVIRATSGKELTMEQYQHVLHQIKTNFSQSYLGEIKLLSLILTLNADDVKPFATNISTDSHWIVDMRNDRLIIYETQSNKFTAIQSLIEQILIDDNSYHGDEEDSNTGQYDQRKAATYSPQTNRFKQMPATMTLITINILVFLITHFTIFLSNPDSVLEKGALSWYLINENQEYYRIFTSMFLHADWSHLFNNMIVLLFLGGNLERSIGRIKYLFLYFGSGVLAGIASVSYNMWKEYALAAVGNTTYSIGASGAIFGVVGAVLWIVVINKGRLKEISFTQMILFVILSLYSGLVNAQIDQVAHVGGFLGGMILSILLYRKQKKIVSE